MTIPYTFQNQTGPIPLSELDANFTALSSSANVNFTQTGSGSVTRSVQNKLQETVSVKDFGATGDGATDDTAAFQSALTYAAQTGRVSIYAPSGRYKLTNKINIAPSVVSPGQNHLYIDFFGDGHSTQIVQTTANSVFSFTGLTHNVSFRDFDVICTFTDNTATNGVFYFPDGNSDSYYENIVYTVDPGTTTIGSSFYICGTDKYNDTVTFINCIAFVRRYGYKIGKGSSVFIVGGRMIGRYPTDTSGVGLYLTGGNGGVWIWGTDFITHQVGAFITQDSGTSNREIFLSQGCVDSCDVGMSITDSSYVSWTGVWAASCNSSNISYAPASDSALLNISGGTIFNAGNLGSGTPTNMYGLSINQYGKALVSGVTFRNNKNRAISCNSGARSEYAKIIGCHFYENGDTAIANSCQAYLAGAISFTNNTLKTGSSTYAVPNVLVDSGAISTAKIVGNEGYQGIGLRTNPTLAASNVDSTNSTGQTLDGYIRQGTVSTVWVNGNPVYDYGAGSSANCKITLQPNDTFKIVYASAPSINWYFL